MPQNLDRPFRPPSREKLERGRRTGDWTGAERERAYDSKFQRALASAIAKVQRMTPQEHAEAERERRAEHRRMFSAAVSAGAFLIHHGENLDLNPLGAQ